MNPTSQQLQNILFQFFGFRSFKPHQEQVISAIFEGRDVFAAMPTGGGKSICYQLPAVASVGLTVVISPLIALMKDQADAAGLSGISAVCLNSSIDSDEAKTAYRDIRTGMVKLLYIAPERLSSMGFKEFLSSLQISLFAVDEAHCISEWGHEFRPDYRELSLLRKNFPGIPIAAFTATATTHVQKDIIRLLKLSNPYTLRAGFNRPELYYQVSQKISAEKQVLDFINDRNKAAGIVYRATRKDVEKTAAFLQTHGIQAAPYHAGLSNEERRKNQEDFKNDSIRVIVATIAFGMGIDKPNIRYIIHADLPRSIEGYYQETGRAGRDGNAAECLLLYSRGDIVKIRYHIDRMKKPAEKRKALHNMEKMSAYAGVYACRRVPLLSHFDETFTPPCGNCDVCRGVTESRDVTEDARKALSAIYRTGQRYGASYIADIVTGTDAERIRRNRHHEIPTFGVGSDREKPYWLYIIDQLVSEGCIDRTRDKYRVLSITPMGKEVLADRQKVMVIDSLVPSPRSASTVRSARGRKQEHPPNGAVDHDLLQDLKRLRADIAKEIGKPAFMVFSDATLQDMSALMPETESDMLEVKGVGPVKMDRFGYQFLDVIRKHIEKPS